MKKLVSAVIMLCVCISANATCTRADLTGTWVVYSSGAYADAERCQLIIPAKGSSFSASCYRANGVTSSATVSITQFDSTCHFISQFVSPTDSTVVDAFVSKGKDSMSGMWIETVSNGIYSGSFNGSKQ